MTRAVDPPWIHARVAPARAGGSAIERVGPLTPYLTQTIVEDALAAGRGSTVHLALRATDCPQVLETLQRRIRVLTGRGIRVAVRAHRGGPPERPGQSAD